MTERRTDFLSMPEGGTGATAEQIAQITRNAEDIAELRDAMTEHKTFATIADVTLDEAVSVVKITTDMNGNAFELQEVICSITMPVGEKQSAFSTYFGIAQGAASAFSRTQHTISTAEETTTKCYAKISNGRIFNLGCISCGSRTKYQQANSLNILQGLGYISADKFTEIDVFTYASGGFPVGIRIVVEGVSV